MGCHHLKWFYGLFEKPFLQSGESNKSKTVRLAYILNEYKCTDLQKYDFCGEICRMKWFYDIIYMDEYRLK